MNKCVFCGGQMKNESVTFVYDDEDKYFFVEHVPAEVCKKCGEKTYSLEVTDEIIDISKQNVKPKKTLQVPVYEYAGKI